MKRGTVPGLKWILITALASFFIAPTFPSESMEVSGQSPSRKVVAYYFHTNTRCSTCKKIEAYSHEAIEKGFKDELETGRLELRIVNYEDSENRHFIKDYKLVTKSLILVRLVDGKQTEWTNLKLVWELTKNKDAFLNYVRGEVKNYLAKN